MFKIKEKSINIFEVAKDQIDLHLILQQISKKLKK